MIRRFSIPLIVLLTSIFLTAVGVWVIATGASERDSARFENATQATLDRLQERLDIYIALLHAAVGLFSGSAEVSREDFRAFAEAIGIPERYPGIQGIGYSRRVSSADTTALAAELWADGYPDFTIWPDDPRPEIHTIVFLEPRDRRNLEALGYDMHTQPVRAAAMDRARDSGEPALSGRVVLVQEIDLSARQAGFLIYNPVYAGGGTPQLAAERRERLAGFVYVPFRADDLFAGIFGREEQPRVAFDLYDGTVPSEEALLHSSQTFGTHPSPRPQFADTVQMIVAGHPWTLVFRSTPSFEDASRAHLIPLFGGLGFVVSLAMFGLTYLEMQSRERAEQNARRAERLSGRLREQADTLEIQIDEVRALNERMADVNQSLRTAHAEMESAKNEAESARAQADEANRAKSRFLTRMSHELRTPLNAIAGYVDLLDLGIRGPVTEDQRKDLDRIRRAQQHLLGLINDVLNFAKLEVGRIQFNIESIPLDTVLRDLDSLVIPLAATRGVEYRREPLALDVSVKADREKLLQVLLNLLSNAVKFTDGGGRVTLSATHSDSFVRLHVQDTGRGIPRENLRDIFEPFVQVGNGSNGVPEGTGLGLTIANEMAQAMGGRITGESEVGIGSAFTLEIPLAETERG